jgi:hypothetical protein
VLKYSVLFVICGKRIVGRSLLSQDECYRVYRSRRCQISEDKIVDESCAKDKLTISRCLEYELTRELDMVTFKEPNPLTFSLPSH